MYRVSPFTYMVDGLLATGLANNRLVCSSIELSTLDPPSGKSCGQYMDSYINIKGGYLVNPNASLECQFCVSNDTNSVLKSLNSDYSHRWRNFGIMWAFIGFNIITALGLYWLARVPKKQKVLDSPPTELASRVQTRVSESAAARAEMSKTEGERENLSRNESSGSEDKVEKLGDSRISTGLEKSLGNQNDRYQSIVKGESDEKAET